MMQLPMYKESKYSEMALGSWASNCYHMGQWHVSETAIQDLNTFLSIVDKLTWAQNVVTNNMLHRSN